MAESDWRVTTLNRVRALIKAADPNIVEELKWVKATNPGTPTWSHDGIVCTGEAYQEGREADLRASGASLAGSRSASSTPGLEGNMRQGRSTSTKAMTVDESAFKALVRQAVALNRSGKSTSARSKRSK